MPNLMDSTSFMNATFVGNAGPMAGNNLGNILQMARQNPQGFADFVRQTNPQAYQQAMQIRNMANPQAIVRNLANSHGLAPNVLRMFGL